VTVIRPARPEDAGALSAFAARLFRETYSPTCRAADVEAYATDAFTPELQSAELCDPASATLLAEADGRLAGYVQLRAGQAPDDVPGRRPVEIARFYVDAEWHGRGVAAELMDAVHRAAADLGDFLWLSVWEENGRAIRFYRRRGFGVVGHATFRMGEDEQRDHLMARPVETRGWLL
jgi:ribosomal protein S18 acetylase RimI-like enzyme